MPNKSLLKTLMKADRAHDLTSQPRTEDVLTDKDVDFVSLFLPEELLKGLEDCGFKKPSPVQLKALPLARCGLGN
jgi:ATP-dependent RNA helicase DDX20